MSGHDVTQGSAEDPFRDDHEEQIALGDIVGHPENAAAYLEAGYRAELFHHAVHRDVWRAGESLIVDRVPPDAPAVARALREQGLDLAAFVYSLPIPPRQSPEGIRARYDRLETLRLARDCRQVLERASRALAADPSVVRNGFVSHAVAALEGMEPDVPAADRILTDITIMSLPEPAWLVAEILPLDTIGFLIGEPGAGKTFILVDLGVSVSTQQPWLGARVPEAAAGPVVFVTAEGTRGLASRLAAAKIARGIPLEQPIGFFIWPDAVNLRSPASVAEFIGVIRPLQPRLVVIETWARVLVGGDENSAKDTGEGIAGAEQIRRATGATVLVSHHLNRAGQGERGSGALRGAADFIVMLEKVDDRLSLVSSKAKDSAPFPTIYVRIVPPAPGLPSCTVRLATDAVEPHEDAAALTVTQGKALEALRTCFGGNGATMAEWIAAVQGVSLPSFYRARKELLTKGLIEERKNRFFARHGGQI